MRVSSQPTFGRTASTAVAVVPQGCVSSNRPHVRGPRPPAVVLGLCKHGLYLARTLARHGVPLIAFESDMSRSSAHTRYGRKIVVESLETHRLIDALVELQDDLEIPAVLFATNDRIVDVLLAYWPRLERMYRLPFGQTELFDALKDKGRLHHLAEEFGFDVPRTRVVHTLEDVASIPAAFAFPVAIKPAWPMGKFKLKRCDSVEELTQHVAVGDRLREPIVVQEWLPGSEERLVFGAYYLAKDGTCAARYGGRKLLAFPDVAGHTVSCETWEFPDELHEQSVAFLRSVGYWGIASIEFKLVPPGRVVFIEVTVGRTDWWQMCCGVNGVEIPIAAYNDVTGQRLSHRNRQRHKYVWHDLEGAFFMVPQKVRRGDWSLGQVVRYLVRRKREALFDWRDWRPFWHFLLHFLRARMRNIGKLVRRTDRVGSDQAWSASHNGNSSTSSSRSSELVKP